MTAALSRIEREYVLEVLGNEKPAIYIHRATEILTITPSSYTITNNRLVFSDFLYSGTVTVVFPHRGRQMCFLSTIKNDSQRSCLNIPEEVLKYDSAGQKKAAAVLRFTLSDNSILSVKTHPEFPIIQQTVNETPAFRDFQNYFFKNVSVFREELRMQLFACRQASFFMSRLYTYTKYVQTQPHESMAPYFLFADDQRVLCAFCTDTIKKLPICENPIRLKIAPRTIKALAAPEFKLIINKKLIYTSFLFANLAFEDKRFLYENAYPTRYR